MRSDRESRAHAYRGRAQGSHPDDPRYAAIYGHRQRAESLDETVKYRLPNRRARSYGQARQHIDLIFTALVRNTEAVPHWGARTTAHAPPLAA